MRIAPENVAKVRAFAERRLSAEEFNAWISAPWDESDLEDTRALIAWHIRRYPKPIDRLRHARLAYARWAKTMPPSEPIVAPDDSAVTLELE